MQEAVAKHEEVVYSKYELVRVVNHDGKAVLQASLLF
jgi:hypothetical protein